MSFDAVLQGDEPQRKRVVSGHGKDAQALIMALLGCTFDEMRAMAIMSVDLRVCVGEPIMITVNRFASEEGVRTTTAIAQRFNLVPADTDWQDVTAIGDRTEQMAKSA